MEKSPTAPPAVEEKKDPDPKDGNWVAGLPMLREACAKLRSGELVLQEGFTLHEAMSAVELGDPKMDSGLAWNGIYMPEEKLEMGKLKPISELSLTDVAAITTMLLRLEVSL
jgi:N-alpha-acetyltransferase 35, NatC auxiliary subunit